MYCRFCGTQIHDNADVCIGCGKLLNTERKRQFSTNDNVQKLLFIISIAILIFSAIFLIIGAIALFSVDIYTVSIEYPEAFFKAVSPEGVQDRFIRSNGVPVYVDIELFVYLFISLLSEICFAVLSLILLIFSNKKIINVISLSTSVSLLILAGGVAFFNII